MKNQCECDRPIIVDERAFELGYICSKCGKNADHKVIGYLQDLGLIKIKRTSKRLKINER